MTSTAFSGANHRTLRSPASQALGQQDASGCSAWLTRPALTLVFTFLNDWASAGEDSSCGREAVRCELSHGMGSEAPPAHRAARADVRPCPESTPLAWNGGHLGGVGVGVEWGWGGDLLLFRKEPGSVSISPSRSQVAHGDPQVRVWLWCVAVLIHLVTFVGDTVIPPTTGLGFWGLRGLSSAPCSRPPKPYAPKALHRAASLLRAAGPPGTQLLLCGVQPAQLRGSLRMQVPSLPSSPSRGAHGRRRRHHQGLYGHHRPSQPLLSLGPALGSVSARHARRPGMER